MLYSQLTMAGCSPTSSIEIIECVEKTYAEYPWNMINRMFVTLQSVYDAIMVHHGDNNYDLPHMNKEFMEREGTLPKELPLSDAALRKLHGDEEEDDY